MNLRKLIILLSVISFHQAFAQSFHSDIISDLQEKKLETKALAGDGLSAFKLSNYAGYGAPSEQKKMRNYIGRLSPLRMDCRLGVTN